METMTGASDCQRPTSAQSGAVSMDTMRSRSNTSSSSTKASSRPKSRASTTSTHSTTMHFHQDQNPSTEGFSFNQHTHAHPYHPDPEEMIRQSAHQLTNPHEAFMLDPALQESHHQNMQYPSEHAYSIQHLHHEASQNQFQPYEAIDHSMHDNMTEEPASDGAGSKRKKGSATTIANDIELRRLFREYEEKSLEDMAKEVLTHERGAKSEKSKQIFAMLWLNKVCKKSTGSVPRSRVFTQYASRCGTERVPPLNPASFGKLVRIIFPGVQTRRLGVRGESKYHYVDLSLEEDHQDYGSSKRVSLSREAPTLSVNTSHMLPDTAVFPSPGTSFQPILNFAEAPMATRRIMTKTTRGVHVDQNTIKQYLDGQSVNVMNRNISFQSPQDATQAEDRAIELPDIWKYLPSNIDSDIADALSALYRAHCISVIDNFRFCKEKMFFHHFSAFQGTLTLPVQKLLAEPRVAPWIKECDLLMYQKMIAFIGPLTTQVVPKAVLDVMKSISERLVNHIETTFRNQPLHVATAKLIPASVFSRLLKRLLRVNASAHAAANILTNPANRQQMWGDWVRYVDAELVVETAVPIVGFLGTKDILKYEVRKLLQPLPSTSHLEFGTFYYDEDRSHDEELAKSDSMIEPVAFPDRWVHLLSGLPNRFPCIADEPDRMVSYHSELWQAALRDLTIGQATSFGSWWIANVFMCEMLQWMVESGGFMSYGIGSAVGMAEEMGFVKTRDMTLFKGGPPAGEQSDGTSGSGSDRPMTGRTEDSITSTGEAPNPQSGRSTAPMNDASRTSPRQLPNIATSLANKPVIQAHDDSGISMGLEEDELLAGMDKYGGEMAMLKSDPADAEGDVIVCP